MQRIDRRWIFAIQIVVFALTIVRPVGLALEVGENTQNVVKVLDSLPPGSLVWFAADYEPAGSAEVEPSARAFMRYAMKHDLRVVSGSMWPEGGMMFDRLVSLMREEFPDKEYGVDYVNLGYGPGGQVFLQQLTQNLPEAVVHVDHYGNDIEDLPLMTSVESLKDFKVVFGIAEGEPGYREYIKIVTDPLDIPYVAALVAVSVSEAMPMLNSGQIAGMLGGLRGAAEFEKASDNPGRAMTGMDAQSFINVTLLGFIVAGNVGYFITKKQGGRQ